jgi:peptidoglycan/xylan/chitin deacetylase (PgdA/CDA1 family)
MSPTNLIRWWIKKTARLGLSLLSAVTGYLLIARWGKQSRVRVLTYHRFRRCHRDPFSVDLERFEEQMRWLSESNLAISLSDLKAFLVRGRRIRNGAVLVTIDDGYRDVLTGALPILRRYGIPAVIFVPTAEIGRTGTDGSRLSAEDLTAMHGMSIDIGSHSWQHRSLGRMSADEAWLQMTRSKSDLEALVGAPVAAFAYPFGTLKDFTPASGRTLARAGYALGFTSQHGAIVPSADLLALPRIKVEGGEPLWMFKLLVAGALDGWRLVDRSLWWLQRSGVNPPVSPSAIETAEHAS